MLATSQPFIFKILIYVCGIILPVAFGIYLKQWLQGDIILKQYSVPGIEASIGLSPIISNHQLNLDVSRILYDNKEYDSVRIERFVLINDDARHLQSGAEFFFVTDDNTPIETSKVVGIEFDYSSPTSDAIHAVQYHHKESGAGFKIETGFPAYAKLEVSLIIDSSDIAPIQNIKGIKITKACREGEQLRTTIHPEAKMISMKFSRLVIWFIGVALFYGILWFLINACLGNQSAGTKIFDTICKFLSGFIRSSGT